MRIPVIITCLLTIGAALRAQTFKVLPLGVHGGGAENNLSAYAVAAAGSDSYVLLDAGTVRAGLDALKERDRGGKSSIEFLRQNVKAYLLSHAHLDHVSGMILAAPDDSSKQIYCSDKTRDALRDKYFTKAAAANWGNEGEQPRLSKYDYEVIADGNEVSIANTDMYVRRFDLSHAGAGNSSAFLLRKDSAFLLYLGDMGPDVVEQNKEARKLWKFVGPLVKRNQVHGIFIECSFTNAQPDDKLYGHLTPQHLIQEMIGLAAACSIDDMKGLKILVTHIKPVGDAERVIKRTLRKPTPLKLDVRFPVQGEKLLL